MRSVSIKLMAQTVDGSLILDKVGRKSVKLCQTVMATLPCQLSKCEHFYKIKIKILLHLILGPLTSFSPNITWCDHEKC